MTTAEHEAPRHNLHIPGAITYMHMASTNPQQSADFYEAVFGWEIFNDRDAFEDKSGCLRGAWSTDFPVDDEPGIMLYIYVDDVDDALRRVVEQGGQIVRPAFPEETLTVALFRDPSGNKLGLWSAPG